MIENNQTNYTAIQDSYGNISSKRICGIILLGFAIIMAVILFCLSIVKPIADSNTALNIIEYFLMGGGGLLGIGVFEKIGFSRKNND